MEANVEVKATLDGPSMTDAITKAILDSVLGEEIRKSVKDYVDKLKRSYDNPLDATVKRVVDEEIYRLLVSEHIETIRAQLREKIDAEVVKDITDKAWDALKARW